MSVRIKTIWLDCHKTRFNISLYDIDLRSKIN